MSTDWEQRYESKDTPWEKGGPHPELVRILAQEPVRGRVLVPGCGFGHDARALAATADEVLGLDIAASAVKAAQSAPEVGGERYECADLFVLPGRYRGAFDCVFEHTCFCAIDPSRRLDYVESVADALRTGGILLAVFYLDPGLDPGESGPPHGATREELDELFGEKFTLHREWVPERTYPGREGRELIRVLAKR